MAYMSAATLGALGKAKQKAQAKKGDGTNRPSERQLAQTAIKQTFTSSYSTKGERKDATAIWALYLVKLRQALNAIRAGQTNVTIPSAPGPVPNVQMSNTEATLRAQIAAATLSAASGGAGSGTTTNTGGGTNQTNNTGGGTTNTGGGTTTNTGGGGGGGGSGSGGGDVQIYDSGTGLPPNINAGGGEGPGIDSMFPSGVPVVDAAAANSAAASNAAAPATNGASSATGAAAKFSPIVLIGLGVVAWVLIKRKKRR